MGFYKQEYWSMLSCSSQPKNNPKGNLKNNSTHHSIKKSTIGIDLAKAVKDLHTENYKTFLRQIDGKSLLVHGLENLILLRWQCFPKRSTDSTPSVSKSQWYFFTEIEQAVQKLVWTLKRSWTAKINLEKRRTKLEDSLTDFKICHKATEVESVCWPG